MIGYKWIVIRINGILCFMELIAVDVKELFKMDLELDSVRHIEIVLI